MAGLRRAVLGLLMASCLVGAAQEKGYWRAASTTAVSITGDITISDAKVTINFTNFPLAQIRKLEAAEVSAVFDTDANAGGSGNLYRLNISGAQRFLHHNTLCGTEDVEWMVTYVLNKDLRIAFFSGSSQPVFQFEAQAGSSQPVFQFEALRNSASLCGTFSYAR
jgi:hypothetical protein